MAKEQYVNLEKLDKFSGKGVDGTKRMGDAELKVKFSVGVTSTFRVNAVVQDADPEYSETEKARNDKFDLSPSAEMSNDGETEVTVKSTVPLLAAGGVKYTFQAMSDEKKVDASLELEARRKLWYQLFAMKGVPVGHAPDDMEAEFWKPDNNHYIKMEKVGGRTNIPFFKTIDAIDRSQKAALYRLMQSKYTLKGKDPYAFVVGFLEYVAKSKIEWHEYEIDLNTWPQGCLLTVPLDDEYLWYDLNDSEDDRNAWFKAGRLKFSYTDKDGNPAVARYGISRADVTPDWQEQEAEGGRDKYKIWISKEDMSDMATRASSGKLNVRAKLKLVKSFLGGFSAGGLNVTVNSTKSWWDKRGAERIKKTLIHEVGHKIGMVADGAGLAPDKPDDHYVGQGHKG
ncbi:MAG: hypothetical protein HKN21_17445, partial [Candidatus Eisenbacteria bacterium]|nr:hypothetical protein [Candidatus Eisenbacteria bacterium]